MRAPLVLFDLDRTLVDGSTFGHLGARLGLEEQIAPWADPEVTGPFFDEAAVRAVAQTLEGLHVQDLAAACGSLPVRDEVRPVVEELWSMGCETGIASRGYTAITRAVAASLGIDHDVAAELETSGGRLTGRVAPSDHRGPCGAYVCKGRALDHMRALRNTYFTIAVGESADDVCMLQAADVGIALDPRDEAVAEAADAVLHDIRDVPAYVERQLQMLPY